ncbi:MAG: pyrroline-5-carboxylate reductase [Pseudomonadota bacterium]|nr:pyrroline-5-carboxylate reductase [Pseudomonadota bacterium]
MDKNKKLLLIGGGKMGSALLEGWLKSGLLTKQFCVQEPNPAAALTALGLDVVPQAGPDFSPDIVVFAIKPQMAAQVIPDVAATLPEACLVISLMAGISIATLRDLAGAKHHFIRTMPNTPAALGRGISALVAEPEVPADLRDAAEWLMQAVGDTVWLSREDQINAVTAISGSGPAYVFHMAEALAASGEALGLEPAIAKRLAYQTVSGAGTMLDVAVAGPDVDAGQLRRDVTSPGGTTEAALGILACETGLGDLMRRTTSAAFQRARDLAEPEDDRN